MSIGAGNNARKLSATNCRERESEKKLCGKVSKEREAFQQGERGLKGLLDQFHPYFYFIAGKAFSAPWPLQRADESIFSESVSLY